MKLDEINHEVKMSVKDSLELMEKLMDMIKMTKEYAELLERRIALLEKGEIKCQCQNQY
jgi:DNA-binding transcriptional regulator GbsR (MarR family)